jgi:predicted MPP superfamily phosphohydrolase
MRRTKHAQLVAFLRRVSEPLLTVLYAGGWPATLAHRLAIQQRVTIAHYDLQAAGAVPHPRPLRIAFAADFHAGATTHPSVIDAACQALAIAQPDLLLLGGDFVSLHAKHIRTLAPRLGRIPAPFGRFAVLGNHDRWANAEVIARHLNVVGIQVLINRNVQLAPPFDHIWVCGLDDADTGEPDPQRALAGAEGYQIVLMHSPDGMRDLQGIHVDLVLCGHTHGGQIALPNGRPLLLPSGALCRKYPSGQFRVGTGGRSTLIVSRGVGYSTLPLRLFADPDIIVCTIA